MCGPELNDTDSSALLPSPAKYVRKEQQWRCGGVVEILVTVFICVAYAFVGPLLIISNKYLITAGAFPHPLLLTAITQLSTSIASFIIVRVLGLVELQHNLSWAFYLRNVATVGAATAITMCLGNSAYLYLSIAFIEILKGFAPVVTMMVGVFMGEDTPRLKPALAVLAICIGTSIASVGEVHMSLLGLATMFGSIYFEAIRLILTQKLLGDKRLHVVEGLYYISPVSTVCVLLAAVFMDVPRLDVPKVAALLPSTWVVFCAVALLGFAVCITSFLVIQRTNVIMLKLLSISRNALVVLSGIVLFDESITRTQMAGYAITIVFFVVYNYLQVVQAAQ